MVGRHAMSVTHVPTCLTKEKQCLIRRRFQREKVPQINKCPPKIITLAGDRKRHSRQQAGTHTHTVIPFPHCSTHFGAFL